MAEDCKMSQVLLEGWKEFSLSLDQFRQISEDFAAAMESGLNRQPSSLQMLPAFVGRPTGNETGAFLALDFGGTNVRVAEVELSGTGKTMIKKMHKVSLKNEKEGYDYTGANIHVEELFAFIAQQVALVASGREQFLGHSFSYASNQTALGRANFAGWTKEIKITGLAKQDINDLLSQALHRQNIDTIYPVAILNDTTATLLTAAYARPEADMGSVCGTGHNTCYYEEHPRHGDINQMMAYNAESGGFDRLPFSSFDLQLDAASESPGQQRLEKMVAGRYLGELTRIILCSAQSECGINFVEECAQLQRVDALSSIDVAKCVGDTTNNLEEINGWFMARMPNFSVSSAERHFVKAVAQMVVDRSATLIAASYAGFLRRMDPHRKKRHIIGINGSLYEKMPGFAERIQLVLSKQSGWNTEQLSFFVVNEAPVIGAAIAAAIAEAGRIK